MSDEKKTKAELIEELQALRRQVAALQTREPCLPDTCPLAELLALGYQSLDAEGRFLYANHAWLELLGYTREEVVGRWFGDFLTPESRQKFQRTFPQFKASGEARSVEHEMVRKDGSIIHASIDGLIEHNEQGEFQRTHCILRDVTEQTRSVEALRVERNHLEQEVAARTGEIEETKEFYWNILESILDGVWVSDREDKVYYVNKGIETISGLSRQELIGVNVLTGFPEETLAHYLKAKETLQPVYYDSIPVVTPAGRSSYQSGWLIPRLKEGHYDGMICTVADVTGRKQAEDALQQLNAELEERVRERTAALEQANTQLRESETRYRAVSEIISDFAFSVCIEPDGMLSREWVTQSVVRSLGYASNEDYLQDPFRLIHPDDVPKAQQALRDLVNHDTPVSHAFRVLDKSGETRWLHVYAKPVWDRDHQRVTHIIGTGKDITGLKKLEDALAWERHLLNALLDISPDFIYFKDRESRFIRNSRSHLDFMGADNPDDILGRSDVDFFTAEHARATHADEQRILETEEPIVGKLELARQADGQFVWVTTNKMPLYDPKGNLAGTMGITRNVDAQMRFQLERDKERRMLQAILDTLPEFIVFKDEESRYVLCNQPVLEFLGKRTDELTGKTDFDFFAPEDAQRFRDEEVQVMQTGETVIAERLLTGPLKAHWEKVIKVPLWDDDGEITGVLSVGRDVSERRQMEERLRLTQFSVDASSISIFRISPEGRFLYVNDAACRRLGYSREALLRMHVWDIDPDYPAERRAESWQLTRSSGRAIFKTRHRTKSGRTFPVEVTSQYLQYEGREYEFAFVTDITERERAQRALKESEELHRVTMENILHPVFITDDAGRFTFICPNIPNILGYSVEEIRAMGNISALLGDNLFNQEELDTEGTIRNIERLLTDKSGRERTFLIMVKRVSIQGGTVLYTCHDITERKEMEEALTQERNLLRTLIDALPDNIYVKDPDSRYLLVNQTMAGAIKKWTNVDDPIGKTVFECMPEKLAPLYRQNDLTVLETGQPLLVEEPLLRSPGERQGWASSIKVPLRDQQGEITGLVGITRDITDRKRAEEALAQERNLLRTLIDALPDHIYVKDREGRHVLVNRAQAESIKKVYNVDDPIGKSDIDLGSDEAHQIYRQNDLTVIQTGQPLYAEEPFPSAEDMSRVGWTIKVPLRDQAGEVTGLVGITRDITERKRAEEALAQERNLLRTLIDAIPDHIYVKDLDSRYLLVNQAEAGAIRRRTGMEDPTGRSTFECISEETAQIYRQNDLTVFETGQALEAEEPYIAGKDSPPGWGWTIKVPLRDQQGEITGLVGITRDITERKQMQEALAQERNLLRTIIDTAPDHIFVKDLEGRLVLVNQAQADTLGFAGPDEAAGKTDLDLYPPEQAQQIRENDRTVIESEKPARLEEFIHDRAGEDRWFWSVKAPLRDHEGRITGLVGIARDITERKRAEEELAQERNLLRTLIDALPDHIFVKDRAGRYLLTNQALRRAIQGIAGLDDPTGKTDLEIGPEEFAKGYYKDDMAVIRTGQTLQTEEPFVEEKDGEVHWGWTVKVSLHDRQGEITGLVGVTRDITDRKRAEEAIAEERNLLRTIIDAMPNHVFVKDLEGRIVLVNQAQAESLGLSDPEEAVGKTDFDLYSSELAQLYRETAQAVMDTGLNAEVEEPYFSPGGQERWGHSIKAPLRDIHGRTIGLVGTSFDMTERKRMEERLIHRLSIEEAIAHASRQLVSVESADLEEVLRVLAEAVKAKCACIFELHDEDRKISLTHEWCAPGRKRHKDAQQNIPVVDFPWWMSQLEKGKPIVMSDLDEWPSEAAAEKAAFQAQGVTSFLIAPFHSLSGQLLGYVGFDDSPDAHDWLPEDIQALQIIAEMLAIYHDRRQAGKSLRESEALLRTLIDTVPDHIYIKDLEGRWILVNQAQAEALGFKHPDEITGKTDLDLYPPDVARTARDNDRRVIETGETLSFEEPGVDREGQPSWDWSIKSPLRDETGQIVGLIGMSRDLTERKRMEQALQQSETVLRTVIDTVPAMIHVKDREANYILVNQEMARLYQTTPEAMRGRNQMDFARESRLDRQEILSYLQDDRDVIDSKEPLFMPEQPFTTPEGFKRWFQTAKAPLSLPDYPDCVLTISFDITEQKRLEERLHQAQKMEAIGQLAGGIAHDFNNLLTAITGYSDFLLQALKAGSPEYEDVITIKRSADRATDLTRQLLAFSRRQILKPKIFNLNEVITDITKMMERLIGEDIELTTRLDKRLGSVKVDPGQMEQVLMNLLVNAREAMPQGGKLVIETKNVILDEEYARERIEVRPGRYIMLAISDTGSGIDPEALNHIFDPFFTTKEMGTGLGLATVYGVIKQSEGHISVYSEPGQGTTFKIYLPRADEESSQTEQVSEKSLRGTETVLLVEDEEFVRHMTHRALTRYGYTVLSARDGQEALLLCQEGRQKIDLLLTDVVMPGGMSGSELARQLKQTYPDVKLLFMSGYTDNAIVQHGVLENGIAFLEKPFYPSTLASKVREVLDS